MARLPRLYAPDIPQLVQAEFARPLGLGSDPTPVAALNQLQEWLQRDAREHKVAVHAWVLLNDRVLLLATPPDASSMPRLIQALGRRMAAGMRYGRVFTSRYRSALIQPGRWVLPVQIWLESLPVQRRYVDLAESWPWSSAASHMGANIHHDPLLSDHPDYWAEGNTPFARQASYRQRLNQGLSATQNQRVQSALLGQWALGETEFLENLQSRASRRITPAARGRPKKLRLDADNLSL